MLNDILRIASKLRQTGTWILTRGVASWLIAAGTTAACRSQEPPPLTLSWEDNKLRVHGEDFPGGEVEVWYLEAYCRANSHTTDWKDTVVPHRTELMEESPDGTRLRLRCRVADGLVVEHVITAGPDEVDFQITAHNPTGARSEVHWAQPCVRVGQFTGCGPEETDDEYAYIKKCFVFLDGELRFLPTPGWTTDALYTPGQVWAGPGVAASDVNPRPLNRLRTSNGLVGCVSGDETKILAIAFEPYQELFQGVIRCLHSDFRLGGLPAGDTKHIHGKIYFLANDPAALVERYAADFHEREGDDARQRD